MLERLGLQYLKFRKFQVYNGVKVANLIDIIDTTSKVQMSYIWHNFESWGEGGDPELGLRDLAALRSKTFAIPSYPFIPHNTVELRYAKYATVYAMIGYVTLCYMLRYAIFLFIMLYSS